MNENTEGQGTAMGQAQPEETITSPNEKLEDNRPIASSIPGAQNPESEEIKKEINLNTE